MRYTIILTISTISNTRARICPYTYQGVLVITDPRDCFDTAMKNAKGCWEHVYSESSDGARFVVDFYNVELLSDDD